MRSEPRSAGLARDPSADVEIVADADALPALAAEWDALAGERHPGAPFRSTAWLLPWWNTFSVAREPRVFLARSGGSTIGLLPAYRAHRPLGARQLRLMGDGVVGSDYLGVLALPGRESEAARAIAERLLDEECDLALDGLAEDEPLLAALAQAAERRGLRLERTPLLPCPFARLDGDFDAWLRSLPGGAGSQLVRRRRWLERQRGYRIEVARSEDEVRGALETLFQLHADRWEVEGGSSAIEGERVRAFHRAAAAEQARRERARVYLLHADGAVRAALYGFACGPRFAFYQSGNQPEWRQRSVGTVVLGAALEEAFREGRQEFDFLRGDEPYKRMFAGGRRLLVRARLVRGGAARALRLVERASEAARATARRVLPAAAVEELRRGRREWRRVFSRSSGEGGS
jgi:CelD/BcsL family acetyltransferase involved in cellulose biosynthesis